MWTLKIESSGRNQYISYYPLSFYPTPAHLQLLVIDHFLHHQEVSAVLDTDIVEIAETYFPITPLIKTKVFLATLTTRKYFKNQATLEIIEVLNISHFAALLTNESELIRELAKKATNAKIS